MGLKYTDKEMIKMSHGIDDDERDFQVQLDMMHDFAMEKTGGMSGVIIRDARERSKRREEEKASLAEIKIILVEVRAMKMEIELMLAQLKEVD
jgi:hypothetical protein